MDQEVFVDMDKTKLNTSEVSRRTGKGRATIKRHADKGKISFELDENGHRLFDASEVARVYAKEIQQQAIGSRKSDQSNSGVGSAELKNTQEKLVDQYESRISHLEKTLDKALNIAGLLESSGSERQKWEAQLETKINDLASQTEQQLAEQAQQY